MDNDPRPADNPQKRSRAGLIGLWAFLLAALAGKGVALGFDAATIAAGIVIGLIALLTIYSLLRLSR